MRCDKFEKLLPAFIAGELDAEPDSESAIACETHLLQCEACLVLFTHALALRETAEFDAAALTGRILQATIPDLCAISAEMLCDSVDSALDHEQEALLRQHLTSCVECQQLHKNLQALAPGLAQLAEQAPPPQLLANVMQQTVYAAATSKRPDSRVRLFLRNLMLRPRFPFEAAFAVTLLWISVLGIPDSLNNTSYAEQSRLSTTSQLLPVQQIQQVWRSAQTNLQQELDRLSPEMSKPSVSFGLAPSQIFSNGASFVRDAGAGVWQELLELKDALITEFATDQKNTE